MTVAQVVETSSDRPGESPIVRDKGIDGWRGIAASFVVFAHAITFRFVDLESAAVKILQRLVNPLAETGVQIFFVISGYIITTLLLREAEHGRIKIASFYARRIFRILPPLLVYYLVIVALAVAGKIALPGSSLIASATFVCNTGIVDCDWWVAHTWSLAVEEQFYLGWPLLAAALAAKARVQLLSGVLLVCTIGAILQPPVAHGNFTSFACIAAGALYASSPSFRRLILGARHTAL